MTVIPYDHEFEMNEKCDSYGLWWNMGKIGCEFSKGCKVSDQCLEESLDNIEKEWRKQ